MNIENLVMMANDIANFFASEPDHVAAVAGVANHLKRYWEPRMRTQIMAHVAAGGSGLTPAALSAVRTLPPAPQR